MRLIDADKLLGWLVPEGKKFGTKELRDITKWIAEQIESCRFDIISTEGRDSIIESLRRRSEGAQNVISELREEVERLSNQGESARLREALEDIAFGRVEGDYSDVRQFARDALYPK